MSQLKSKPLENLCKNAIKAALVLLYISNDAVVIAQPPVRYRPMPPPGRGYGPPVTPPGRNFRPIYAAPPIRGNDDDNAAAELMAAAIGSRGCENAGEVLRSLSNQLLANSQMINTPDHMLPPVYPGDRRGQLRQEMRRRWKTRMVSPQFWTRVWDRLAEAYRSCDKTCFDDGISVGQISGALYCQASIELQGLPGVGYIPQAPLPMCQNSVFVGCQQGYSNAVRTASGCSTYTQGNFATIFGEYVSQDCHLD